MMGAMRRLSSSCWRASPRWVVRESSAWKPINPPRMRAWLRWALRDGRAGIETEATGGVFEEAYRTLRQTGDDIVSVHLSSKVSGTHNSALMAAKAVDEKAIDVVDSLTTSMALGFMALEAAKLARAGKDRAAITERLRALVPKARVICVVDTLTYLERGGRIGHTRALLGSLLNAKPIRQLKDGEVVPLGRARGRPQALSRLVELLERDGHVSQLAIMHGAAPADAEQLRERVAASYPGVDIQLTEIGAVLGTHTGPGVIGFTYLVA